MTTLEERFWSKVDRTDYCWNWTGGTDQKGYGEINIGGNIRVRAHRLSYLMHHGPIPPGKLVDHRCHNHSCVNPSHLRAVTPKQNSENLRGAHRDSKSGVRGVHLHGPTNRWKAEVCSGGVRYHVGLFATIEEAETAVIAKRNELYTHNDVDREIAK